MTALGVPGVSVEATVTVTSWADLGEHLAGASSIDQAEFLSAFAYAIDPYPMQLPVIAERLLLAEKDDPDLRAVREAVQRFCADLLEHLDEGSR